MLSELETQQDAAEPAAKKRRSRWAPEEAPRTAIVPGLEIALPASLAHLADLNPEVLELQRRLANVSAAPASQPAPLPASHAVPADCTAPGALQVNQRIQLIQAGNFVDETPEGLRSPSPEPVYNECGQRANTREQRLKDKLMRERSVSSGAAPSIWGAPAHTRRCVCGRRHAPPAPSD